MRATFLDCGGVAMKASKRLIEPRPWTDKECEVEIVAGHGSDVKAPSPALTTSC